MPVKKVATKAPAKKAVTKTVSTKKTVAKKADTHHYVLNKRAVDGKWSVKYKGGEKAIKLFDTKAEAEAYTKKMAENQGGSYIAKASKGKNKGKFQKK